MRRALSNNAGISAVSDDDATQLMCNALHISRPHDAREREGRLQRNTVDEACGIFNTDTRSSARCSQTFGRKVRLLSRVFTHASPHEVPWILIVIANCRYEQQDWVIVILRGFLLTWVARIPLSAV